MKNVFPIILFTISIIAIQGCNNLPEVPEVPTEKIKVGPGPEDMVLDTLLGQPRLIISCTARRESHKPYGEMVSLDLTTGNKKELIRHNEPEDLIFRPHGIYLEEETLYVISHEREPDYHPILAYRIHGDSLEFRELINTSNQHSPNALVTGPEGEIYFVNDSGKRGRLAEKALKLKRASVVKLAKDSAGEWKSEFMAMNLGYPAGINRIGSRLYVGDVILHRIHVFNISHKGLTPVTKFRNLKGNDNIRIHKGNLLTVGHIKPFKFLKHAKDPEKLSPIEVFYVNPENGESTTIYATNGSSISAGSAAIIFENNLYVCQVFDPYILKVALEKRDGIILTDSWLPK